MTAITREPAENMTDNPQTPGDVMIALESVTFGYAPAQPIIEGFSWQIREGDKWSVLGPSGSGKTTLLYLLAGLRTPQAGQVRFRGETVIKPNNDVGLMLQDYGLLPWMNAEKNVQLGMKIRQVPRKERHRVRAEWLERMQIGHVAKKYPAQLSGGQRQRVALARVLALQSDLLLLDEPLSAVDEMTRERLQKTLWHIQAELNSTVVMVTHSVEEAAILTDHILIFPEDGALRDATVLRSPFSDAMPGRQDADFQAFCADIRKALGL